MALLLRASNTPGLWDTVGDTHPGCPARGSGELGYLYTNSHQSRAEAASGAARGAPSTSGLLFTQAKEALAARGRVQQGPEPGTPGFSDLSSAPEALWTTGP